MFCILNAIQQFVLKHLNKWAFIFCFQGLNNVIAIDFDYREEFIYWIDSSRPNGSRINRMSLNGSDIKVIWD